MGCSRRQIISLCQNFSTLCYRQLQKWFLIIKVHIHSLACAECDDSLPFSGASFILLYCVLFTSTQFPHLVFHPSLLHLAIYFSVYLSALLFPNSYLKLFWEFCSLPCTCPNQRNLFSFTASARVGFLTIAQISLLVNILQHCFFIIYWAQDSTHLPSKNV